MTQDQCLGTISYSALVSLDLVEPLPTETAVTRPAADRPPVWISECATTPAATLGDAAHRTLAYGLSEATASDWHQLCRRFGEKFRVDSSDYPLLYEYVTTIAAALTDATIIESEYAFSFRLANWTVTGQIDLVVSLGADTVRVIDFKTGMAHASPTQLKIYLLACRYDDGLANRLANRALTGAQIWCVDLTTDAICRYEIQLTEATHPTQLAAIETDIESRLQEAARPPNLVALWGPEWPTDEESP